jgi:23S rRNA pseudoU1915 N3-methylase RlmH
MIDVGSRRMIGQAPMAVMKVQIIAAGRPALAYARLGVDEYLKRLGRYGAYGMEVVKSGTREEVSERLLERSRGSYRIALDERGELLGTREFAGRLDALALRGDIKSLSFLIGGSDGALGLQVCGEQRESIGRTDLQIDLQEPAARFESAAFQKKILLGMRAAGDDGKAT